jgi:hypothetical protein
MEDRQVAQSTAKRYVGQETTEVDTRDSICQKLSIGQARIYLKLDLQGSELAALRGGSDTLAHVEVVETEMSLVPLYVGAPLSDEVYRELRGLGFRLCSAECAWDDPASGEMLQIDGIFSRGHP